MDDQHSQYSGHIQDRNTLNTFNAHCQHSRNLVVVFLRWIVNNKADGIRTATQVAGEGLRFAGQLSAAVLRVLLQVSVLEAD